MLARVYAARGIVDARELDNSLAALPDFGRLANIGAAVARLVASGAFLPGPSRAAAAVRRWFGSGTGWVQGETGVGTTRVGQWVGRNKKPLRIGAIFLPAIIFLLWGTPTVTVLVVLVVLALLALLAIELVGRTPPPAEVGTPTSAV